jgi:aspartokinase-like uncharacterized kinase
MSGHWNGGSLVATASGPAGGPLVVKVGGSLFARPSWPTDLRRLLETQGRPCLLVVGGGPVVDGLRTIDAVRAQPAAFMHRLAISAMGLTADLVATTLGLPRASDPAGVAADTAAVLDPVAWFATDASGHGLPADWRVTSDSIAARVAGADGRLLLAKSVPPPDVAGGILEKLAAAGWVDAYFPQAAAGLATITWAAPA